jgi:hypothetical protein
MNQTDRRIRALRDILSTYGENIRMNNENMIEYTRMVRALINLSADSSAIETLTSILQEEPVSPSLTMSRIDEATRNVQYDCDTMNQTQCPIALDDFVEHEPVCQIISCGHMFRRTNLMQWLDTHNCCPVCRYDLREYNAGPVPPPASPETDMDQIARVLTSYVNEQARHLDASGNSNSIYTFRFPLRFRRS